MHAHPEQMQECAIKYAELLKTLHSTDGELMFIDMADTDLGHPIFDYSGIALAMITPTMGNRDTVPICGLEKEEIYQFLTLAFTHLLGLTDPEDIKQLIPRLLSLSLLKYSMVIGHNSQSVNELRPMLLAYLRNGLFANIDQIRKQIQWFIDRV